jgi:glucose-6-phosphate isomerase
VKRDQLVSQRPLRASRRLQAFSADVAGLLAREGDEKVRRLLARDPTLWSDEAKAQPEIADRLGWLELPGRMAPELATLTAFAEEVRKAGYTRVLLLGMGGSSLAPEVFSRACGARRGFPTLTVLDTTDPGAITAAEKAAPLGKTFFLVSSKSGTTLETSDLFAYFWKRTGGRAEQFAAITDPGTPLASLAKQQRLRRLFENPPDIGGRYSALSYFGLVPAALLGVDLAVLLDRAAKMAAACAAPAPEANPGAQLGAALATGWTAGRDKVTFVTAPALQAFGSWAEQLLAESTGKRGKGLVPVAGEPPGSPTAYGKDRLFVSLELEEAPDAARQDLLAALEAAGHPVVRLSLRDLSDLGAEFYRWEVATALAGAWLGINPFDQPNVAESKANTDRVLQQLVAAAAPSAPAPADPLRLREALAIWLAGITAGDYVALLAYLAPDAARDAELAAMRAAIRDALGTATTAGYGPRYLHSTGQLHKGGPPTGAFLALEDEGGPVLKVPDEDYDFGMLKLAQELGDLIALERRGRRVLRVRLGPGGLAEVRAALAGALQPGR